MQMKRGCRRPGQILVLRRGSQVEKKREEECTLWVDAISVDDVDSEVADQAIEELRVAFRVWVTIPISQWDECIGGEGGGGRCGRRTQGISRGGSFDGASDGGG